MTEQNEKNALIALIGAPNSGKTALFNAMTGSRQKVANFRGVTVEKKQGQAQIKGNGSLDILDLPGTYSLNAKSLDERITRDVLLDRLDEQSRPDAVLLVADATNLERTLAMVLEIKRLGFPTVVALNMMDLATSRGLSIDFSLLEKELGCPVVPTIATQGEGVSAILEEVAQLAKTQANPLSALPASSAKEISERFGRVDEILKKTVSQPVKPSEWTRRLDRVLLHPFWGAVVLITALCVIFQAVFTWATPLMGFIETGVEVLSAWVSALIPAGPLQDLLVNGVIAGVGSVIIFLPQILILFLFILILEDSGYMARVAFIMDRVMGSVGLHGRAFIPLLSSYACAIPGIMATRTIESKTDRFITMMIAPLTTCSARLPVYTLLIAAFIPGTPIFGPFTLQGLVMLSLYFLGIFFALIIAALLKRSVLSGPKQSLLLELPTYKWPNPKNVLIGLYDRGRVFVKRAGTVILTVTVVLWFLSSYPKIDEQDAASGTGEPAIVQSYAGQIGKFIEPVVAPLGFDWRIGVALVPGLAAREVMVGALATVYSVEEGESEEQTNSVLGSRLASSWSLATALSLLVWYIFAPQCLATLAVTRRETNSWRWPIFMFAYLFGLAYLASWATYNLASRFFV